MKVTKKEIVEALRGECNGYQRVVLADRIEAEGIEQPSDGYGRTPIAWAMDTDHHGRCYSVSDEFLKAFPNFPIPPSLEPVGFTSQSSLDDLGHGRVSGIQMGTHSETYDRTVLLFTMPPTYVTLLDEILAVGVNNHMAIQAIIDRYKVKQ